MFDKLGAFAQRSTEDEMEELEDAPPDREETYTKFVKKYSILGAQGHKQVQDWQNA